MFSDGSYFGWWPGENTDEKDDDAFQQQRTRVGTLALEIIVVIAIPRETVICFEAKKKKKKKPDGD